jgi:tRNA threonylcarbamoyladenosine biosynthesis protein TsaB
MVQKSLILAVETSGRIGSVAIAAGRKLLAEATFSGPMRHSSEIFPAIRGLLDRFGRKPKDIEHIYISVGPGSFTGLRIAVSIAKIMHLASAVKIVAVDTLDVIAANAADYIRQEKTDVEKIAVILDAKRGQFYIAVYQRTSNERQAASRGIWKKIFPDSLMTAPQFLDRFSGKSGLVWLLGEGLVYYADKFKPVPSGAEGAEGIHFFDEQYWTPRAEKVHLLGYEMSLKGQFADPVTLQPKYLRCPDVKIKPR